MSPCAICGTLRAGTRVTSRPRTLFRRSFSVLRCPDCGIAATVPPPEADESYYAGPNHYEDHFDRQRDLYRGFANHLLDYATDEFARRGLRRNPVRMLDVGAGRGWLVEQARVRGIDAVGVELNRNNVQIARQTGVPLFTDLAELGQARPDLQCFDVLIFSAVLEHLPEPEPFLHSFARHLEAGGLVVVSQAAFDGFLPRVAPWLWYGWQPNEHFWHFDEGALHGFMRRCGFDELRLTRGTLHHGFTGRGPLRQLVGKNLASALGRLGAALGQGDRIYACGRYPRP